MDDETMAEIDALRARVAALEFAVGIERADEREDAVAWALAYETAAPSGHGAASLAVYAAERLRGRVRGAVDMGGPRGVEALLRTSPADVAKRALFESLADPAVARSAVDALRGSTWADYGLPAESAP